MLYARPDLMHRILDVNADAVAAYLNAQIDAGAQAVMVFDSWGGVLADGAFQRFSLALHAPRAAQLKREHDGRRIPRIVFTKGGGPWLRGDRRQRRRRGRAWTGPSTWARRARASATASRCRATSTRTCCSRRPTWCAPRRRPCSTASARRSARRPLGRPRLQPRPRHQPAHAARACGRAGRGGAQPFARACARLSLLSRPPNGAVACR